MHGAARYSAPIAPLFCNCREIRRAFSLSASTILGRCSLPALGASQQSLISQYPPNLLRGDRQTRRHTRYFSPVAPPHLSDPDRRKFLAPLLALFIANDALAPLSERGAYSAGPS